MQGLAVKTFGISMRKMLLATLIGNLKLATSALSRIIICRLNVVLFNVQITMRFVIYMCPLTSPKIDFLVLGEEEFEKITLYVISTAECVMCTHKFELEILI